MNDTSNEKPDTTMNDMNEQSFQERLWANPNDNSPEFTAAIGSSTQREADWLAAKDFNCRLSSTMKLVQAPDALREILLQIPEQAANDSSYLRRILPVAAVMLIAISIGLYYQPDTFQQNASLQNPNQPDANAELTNDLFGHIYMEEPYYGNGSVIAVAEVNSRITPIMVDQMQPGAATDGLEVTFAKDCYIAKQRAMHLVVKGKTGPINVVMIPSQVVDAEISISDQRFNGLVTPASGGTLVIIGNKQEPIAAYRDQLASSLNWKY